jgi:hypothetical protein
MRLRAGAFDVGVQFNSTFDANIVELCYWYAPEFEKRWNPTRTRIKSFNIRSAKYV